MTGTSTLSQGPWYRFPQAMWHFQTRKRGLFFFLQLWNRCHLYLRETFSFPLQIENKILSSIAQHVATNEKICSPTTPPAPDIEGLFWSTQQSRLPHVWASFKAYQEDFSKNAAYFLIPTSVQEYVVWHHQTAILPSRISQSYTAVPRDHVSAGSLTCLLTLLPFPLFTFSF